ncbi:cytochrome P450 [Frankia sp. Cj3]|uniref:cytochrome P450 n=1 Tax=Frankia sp. Cj3 TaxID=2880976 RepID=UPI001EF68799|nr:cytochrome P450 [Frankia sp. Cj3]
MSSLSTSAPSSPPARTPPVAAGSFLLGSAAELRGDMLGAFLRAFERYGDAVCFRVGPPGLREIYLVFHPDAAQRVLASSSANYRKDNVFYREVRGAFGNGILTSQDADWHRQRRFLQPLFTTRRVAEYAAAMGGQVESLVNGWRRRGAGTIDLDDEITGLTLRVVCRVLFGDDLDQVLPVVRREFGRLAEAVLRRGLAPIRMPLRWPTPVNRQLAQARSELYSVCDQIIAQRRASGARYGDLLGLLLDARDSDDALTDAEVRDQVLIFLLAGHETTSTALTYALHLLGRHPAVQERVRDEADAIAGIPTVADVPALPYSTMVLKETMRLYPSAPIISRCSLTDEDVCGYRIPAGSDLLVVPWVTHRHPLFWDRPERFEPERFTPEREKARHRYAWFPFGGGPRGCIGQHFSMLESTIALAGLVQNFTFTAPVDDPPYTNHITLRPTSGVPSLVTPR